MVQAVAGSSPVAHPLIEALQIPLFRREGRHILVLGGTGSRKTVSADRIALGRVATDRVPALVLDPKGDERLMHDLSALADFIGRPFLVFDPLDDGTDRWDPLWSVEPGRTVARILSPIQTPTRCRR